MTIEVDESVASLLKSLQAQAVERDLGFAQYLGALADANSISSLETIGLDEFDAIIEEFANDRIDGPYLPLDFSRADIYADHD